MKKMLLKSSVFAVFMFATMIMLFVNAPKANAGGCDYHHTHSTSGNERLWRQSSIFYGYWYYVSNGKISTSYCKKIELKSRNSGCFEARVEYVGTENKTSWKQVCEDRYTRLAWPEPGVRFRIETYGTPDKSYYITD